jgi:hypothetical protein
MSFLSIVASSTKRSPGKEELPCPVLEQLASAPRVPALWNSRMRIRRSFSQCNAFPRVFAAGNAAPRCKRPIDQQRPCNGALAILILI